MDVLIVFSVFFGIASLVALPLAVLLGLPLGAWLLRAKLAINEKEVELKLLQLRRVPPFVDVNDPAALLRWSATERELREL